MRPPTYNTPNTSYPRSEFRELSGIDPHIQKIKAGLVKLGEAAKSFNFTLQTELVYGLEHKSLSAGQVRALYRLSQSIPRWRCTYCFEDIQQPKVHAHGVLCDYCGNHEGQIYFWKSYSGGGYTWCAAYTRGKDEEEW